MENTFEERFLTDKRWELGRECLNMEDVNRPPGNYGGDIEEWINELTTFISLFPKWWEEIRGEYMERVKRKGKACNTMLAYYRDEEGYLRPRDEKDIYLRIRIEHIEKIAFLKMIADIILQNWGWGFNEYRTYTLLDRDGRTNYLCSVKAKIARCIGIKRTLVQLCYEVDYEKSSFEAKDLYIDLLNGTYIIL